jgi:hypothetical protein
VVFRNQSSVRPRKVSVKISCLPKILRVMGVFRVIRVWVRLDSLLLRDLHPLLMSLPVVDDGVLLPFLSSILGLG